MYEEIDVRPAKFFCYRCFGFGRGMRQLLDSGVTGFCRVGGEKGREESVAAKGEIQAKPRPNEGTP